MGKMHARMPKNFVLEERLERYARAIEADPARWRGQWAQACFPLGGDIRKEGASDTAQADDADSAGEKNSIYGARPVAKPHPAPAPRDAPADPAAARAATGTRPADAALTATDRFRAVRLDLGCGKGTFLAESARREPEALFIGIDAEPVCVAYAAQRICEQGLPNALVVPGRADRLGSFFAPGELASLTLNFPTPHPKAHYAHERLTSVERLLGYRDLLAPGGTVTLRTDSLPLWRFSLKTFELAGYRALWSSEDARADHPELPETEYEARTRGLGATVYGICATPGPLTDAGAAQACARARELPRSLVDYLPDDTQNLGYVPLGMERAVENLRNRRLKEQARALPRRR